MDRRHLMLGTGSLALAGMTGASNAAAMSDPAAAPGAAKPAIDVSQVTFETSVDEFEAHFRMERDLVAEEGTTLAWYHWLAYVIPGVSAPQPLVRFEGMEYSYFRKVAENTYRIHAHNVSYPRDIHTNAFLSVMTNPVTGQQITVEPTVLLEDPGTVHSPKGFRNMNGDGSYVQPFRYFRKEGDQMKFESVRTAPPSWPVNHMESTVQWCDVSAFDDKSITSLPSKSAGVYVFPYPKWMEMGDRGGHMLGFIDGQKITGVEEMPDDFRNRVKSEYPELLLPRWGEFDRPPSFEY